MTQILNLDTLEAPTDKQLILKGVTYAFQPFTVSDFIEQVKDSQALQATDSANMADIIELSIKTIVRAFPGVPDAELRALTMTQLTAVSNFVRDVAESEAAPAATVTGAADASGNVPGVAS